MATVNFIRGTQAKFDALQSYVCGAVYFIYDTRRIYLADREDSSVVTQIAADNISYVTEVPSASNAIEGQLYIHTGNGTLHTKVGDSVIQIGGGEATQIADGVVTFTKFADGVVSSEIGEEPSDTKLVTESAVTKYVSGIETTINNKIADLKSELTSVDEELGGRIDDLGVAFVAVETVDSETDGKFVLRFTDFNGTARDIELDKEKFLKSAALSEDGKTLSLTLTDDTVVDIDLAEIVATAKSVKTVDEIAVTTKVGELASGTTIPAGTSVEDLLVMILSKDKDPSKTDPSITAFNVTGNGSALTDFEVGTSVTPQWTSTFSAGAYSYKSDVDGAEPVSPESGTGVLVESWSIKQSGTEIGTTEDGTAESSFIIGDGTAAASGSVSFSAEVSHTAGNYALTQLNKLPATAVRIAKGTKSASDTLTFFRKMFGGGTTEELTSGIIRGLSDSVKSKVPTTADSGWVFNAAKGSTKVVFAYPKVLTTKTPQFQIFTMAWGDTSGFVASEVEVADSRGGENGKITYTVYTYTPAGALTAENTQYRVYFK